MCILASIVLHFASFVIKPLLCHASVLLPDFSPPYTKNGFCSKVYQLGQLLSSPVSGLVRDKGGRYHRCLARQLGTPLYAAYPTPPQNQHRAGENTVFEYGAHVLWAATKHERYT